MKLLKLILFFVILLVNISCTKQTTSKKENYVVTSPELAEIICALGAGDLISGVTAECDFPEELKSKKIVGNFGKINFDDVINLSPTIVFTSSLEQQQLADQLKKLKINTSVHYPKSISQLYEVINRIGTEINRKNEAVKLINSMKSAFAGLVTDSEKNPRVFIEIYGDPIMSVSDKSFVGELVKLAGGDNIFSELPRDYSRVKIEEIIENDPEIIITTYPGVTKKEIKSRMGWEHISAVKNDRIYSVENVNPDLILRAGPRIIDGVKALNKVIYGDGND